MKFSSIIAAGVLTVSALAKSGYKYERLDKNDAVSFPILSASSVC